MKETPDRLCTWPCVSGFYPPSRFAAKHEPRDEPTTGSARGGRQARTGPVTLEICRRARVIVYLLHGVTVNHVRHERDIPVEEGGRSQVQWNLVCHHHCDVHSWRNSLNCPTWKSTEKEGPLAQQEVFRKTCLHKKGQEQREGGRSKT